MINLRRRGMYFTYIYVCIYTYMYIMECYSAINKNKIMPFTATWIDVEIIILSEISQRHII